MGTLNVSILVRRTALLVFLGFSWLLVLSESSTRKVTLSPVETPVSHGGKFTYLGVR